MHKISLDWLITGELPKLQDMLLRFAAEGPPPSPETMRADISARLARLDPVTLAFVDKYVMAARRR